MSNATCDFIVANPDVGGIGIRVSFYLTMLVTAIFSESSAVGPALVGLAINITSLIIAGIVQMTKQSLTLYHFLMIQQYVQMSVCTIAYTKSFVSSLWGIGGVRSARGYTLLVGISLCLNNYQTLTAVRRCCRFFRVSVCASSMPHGLFTHGLASRHLDHSPSAITAQYTSSGSPRSMRQQDG